MLHTDCGGPTCCERTGTKERSRLHAEFMSWKELKKYETSIARLIKFNSSLNYTVSMRSNHWRQFCMDGMGSEGECC